MGPNDEWWSGGYVKAVRKNVYIYIFFFLRMYLITSSSFYCSIVSLFFFFFNERWWDELGGYDPKMEGWGGENIDQSLRIWLCGGEIVSVQDSYVAHMWRDGGKKKTMANYNRVGDSYRNKWRAVSAWFGPFKQVVLNYPEFKRFASTQEDLSTYEEIQRKLQCQHFGSYIDRFSNIYFESGVLPEYIFSLESVNYPGYCLSTQGFPLGHGKVASGQLVILECDIFSPFQIWHHANRENHENVDVTRLKPEHFHSLRMYQSDQCVRYSGNRFDTSVAVIDGSDLSQTARWVADKNGDNSLEEGRIMLDRSPKCMGVANFGQYTLRAVPCMIGSEESDDLPLWKKTNVIKSRERRIYERWSAKRRGE